jgi:hypothetical protein
MSSRRGSLFALFFAACFLALQFHAIALTQLENSNNQGFHFETDSIGLKDSNY